MSKPIRDKLQFSSTLLNPLENICQGSILELIKVLNTEEDHLIHLVEFLSYKINEINMSNFYLKIAPSITIFTLFSWQKN